MRSVWTLLLAGSLVACSGERKAHDASEVDPVSVAVETVSAAPVATRHEVSGTLKARNTATLSAKVVGYVAEVLVQAGDQVVSGQNLVRLDAREVTAELSRARAGLAEARAANVEASSGLEAAQAQARVATATYQRFEGLVAKRAATRQEYDEVEARYKSAMAQEAMAQARLTRAQAGLAQAEAAVAAAGAMEGYTRITAPFTGRVVECNAEPGNLASPGVVLLVVEQEGPLRAEARVDESMAASIHVGDSVDVQLESLGRHVVGRVSEVVPQVDPGSRSFLVKVELGPEAAGPAVRPGMFARLRFRSGAAKRTLIPRAAVNRRGQLDRVAVVQDERIRLRLITLGRIHGDRVEVLSGLEAGELVVSRWVDGISDGRAAKVSR